MVRSGSSGKNLLLSKVLPSKATLESALQTTLSCCVQFLLHIHTRDCRHNLGILTEAWDPLRGLVPFAVGPYCDECLLLSCTLWTFVILPVSHYSILWTRVSKLQAMDQIHLPLHLCFFPIFVNKFMGTQPLPFASILCVAAFVVQWQNWMVTTDVLACKFKYLAYYPLQEKFADSALDH